MIHGDCLEEMARMPDQSIDAVVCDPPYNLSFMGKEWDSHDTPLAFQNWCQEWASECLRVLKPGGHLVAAGGSRTFHRLVAGIEDAGFEIRDCVTHLHGAGFPKSLDVSKQLDRAAGAEREVVGRYQSPENTSGNLGSAHFASGKPGIPKDGGSIITGPATPEAQKWQGWGTALKPAVEFWTLARKPIEGTVAQNCQKYGTGALNIDGTRIAHADDLSRYDRSETSAMGYHGVDSPALTPSHPSGRWPANLVLDESAGQLLDEQGGERPSGARKPGIYGGIGSGDLYGEGGKTELTGIEANTGGASRFFYCAKSSSGERNAGLSKRSEHPTVKPIDLMRWLVRLVTPPGGTVLDPFTGSGTTGIAAHLEGMEFIGIEREAEYLAIAEARIQWWSKHSGDTAEILAKAGLSEKAEKVHTEVGQLTLGAE